VNPIHRVRLVSGIVAGFAAALLSSVILATTALAYRIPPPGGPDLPVQPPPQVHTIVTGGMPGWQITLIAAGAAILAAALAVALDRARTARGHLATPDA
jgi:hypothetical protein